MGLEKAIEHGKEHRRQYGERGDFCKLVDKSCRNHGDCNYCKGNRLYNTLKRLEKVNYREN